MKYAACLLCLSGLLAIAAAEPPNITFDRAVQALSSGDYSAAEQGFQTVIREQPGNVGAIGNLGILYARTNRADQAIAAYRKALKLSPNDESILLNLGLVYLKQEQYPRALPNFERVVALDPRNKQARQLRALCQINVGQAQPAIQDLLALKETSPADPQLLALLGFAYLKSGDKLTAQTIFQQMLQVAPPAQAQFLLGRASYDAGLFPQAEDSYLQVQKLDPQFPGLHLELAKVYISQRRTDDAVRELKAVLAENAKDEESMYLLGSLLIRESKFEEGIPYLEEARKLKPDSWAVFYYLGRAKLHQKQTPEAVSLLGRAAELNPDDSNVQYQLGRALQAAGQKEAASRAFAKARGMKTDALNEATIPGTR